MRRSFLSALLFLFFLAGVCLGGSAAQAQEINTDTTCSDAADWMTDSGWSVSGGKCVASGATRMAMLHQMSDRIKANHWYEATFTVSNYSAGYLRAFAGVQMPASAPAGSWVTLASESDIADNFTYSDALATGYTPKASITGPGDSIEDVGAFRFACNHAGFAYTDPLVYPGMPAPHLHEFYGNSGLHTARDQDTWTNEDFRTRGGSTCDNQATFDKALNRSGYWIPAIFDGEGNVVRARSITIYYKGPSNPAWDYTGELTEGTESAGDLCDAWSYAGDCQNIPRHLRMTFGYKATTGLEGSTDTASAFGSPFTSIFYLSCYGGTGNEGGAVGGEISGRYDTLAALMASGECPVNSQIHVQMSFPNCWDGVHVDSPDHRSHVAYTDSNCPSTHPVSIPTINIQVFYTVTQAMIDGKARLSSDEMASNCAGVPVTLGPTSTTAGCTYHGDYWEAWSPTARNAWFEGCIWAHNTCSNEFGGSTGLKTENSGFAGDNVGMAGGAYPRPDEIVPLTEFGMSRDYTANGTYTVRFKAARDGIWGFMGLDGFTGEIDNISIQEIKGAR